MRSLIAVAGLAVVAIAAAAVAAATLPASSGSTPEQGLFAWPASTSAPIPAPDPVVNLRDPDDVCDAFAAALLAQDATVDAGPGDAYRRAAAYATPELAAALAVPPARAAAAWEDLAANNGRVTVEIEPYTGEAPPGRGGVAYRAAVVVATSSGPAGWRGGSEPHTVYCTLHRSGDEWSVAAYDLKPTGGKP